MGLRSPPGILPEVTLEVLGEMLDLILAADERVHVHLRTHGELSTPLRPAS